MRDLRFRSNPLVDLKRLGDLAPDQAEAFRDLEKDPEFYGLLVPRPPLSMTVKSIANSTAELFLKLATPSQVDEDLADFVLDGIFEVESGDGFVSGADALPLLCPLRDTQTTSMVSRDALLYAQDLETADVHALSMALYHYNRIPLTPRWQTQFPTGEAVLAHVGADRGSLRALLERNWNAAPWGSWLSWSPKAAAHRDADAVTYKLYVSPRPERIRDAFEVLARVLAEFPGTPFKIGSNAAGLLRPDKLVAYFWSADELREAADALRRELAGCDAHGVPFTATFDDTALLSWGIDPPDNERVLSWLNRDSWRSWLAQRLGAAMAIAKSAHTANAIEPWRFAIERVRRLDVEIETWTPSPALWSGA